MASSADERAAMISYSQNYRIQQLLEDLTAHLLTEQPEDPITSLQLFLSELQQGKDSSLLSETNLESTFEQLDEAKTGFISLEAAGKGIKLLGGSGLSAEALEERFPGGEVSKNAFVMFLKEFFQHRWAAPAEPAELSEA
ncbi:hypothetical protein N2152v2_011146 [Parachlorella kessleri]